MQRAVRALQHATIRPAVADTGKTVAVSCNQSAVQVAINAASCGITHSAANSFQNGDSSVEAANSGWVPYTYPHPLRLGAAPPPPSGDTTPPTVALTAPAAGATVSGTVNLTANATDNGGVAGVQFRVNGTNLGTEDPTAPYGIGWNTTQVTNGTYTLSAVARDAAGNTTTSQTRTVTVANATAQTAPTISTQPNSTTVSVGQTATFSVAAAGSSPLSYQWQLNGTAIAGASAATYTTPPTALADSGRRYRVVVSNGSGQVTSNSATLTVTQQSSGTGLFATYNFNEGSGTRAADSSGNNRTGTLINGPTWTTGKNGSALRFDGTNDYVTIGNQTLPSAFTFSAWVYNGSNNVYETIASFGTNRQFSITSGSLAFWNGSGSEYRFGSVPTGSWQHVAFTYDGSTLRAYLNGAPLGTPLTRSLPSTSGQTFIGAWPNANGAAEDLLSGRLDDIRIYSRALSQSEIQSTQSQPVSSNTLALSQLTRITAGSSQTASAATDAPDPAHASLSTGAESGLPVILGEAAVLADGTRAVVEAQSGAADAVVIAGPPSTTHAAPGVVRLADIDGSGFSARFQPWRDGEPTISGSDRETVPYLVARPGRYEMPDGSTWEVGTVPLDGARSWTRARFNQPFARAPFLFLTVQSANDPRAVTVRVRNVTSEGFLAALQQATVEDSPHLAENVGYLAVQSPPGGGRIVDTNGGQVPYLARKFLVDERWTPVFSQKLKIEEDQAKDADSAHPDETVDVLLLGQQLFAQPVSNHGTDTAALRRMPPVTESAVEWGMIPQLDQNWTVLPLAKRYVDPVVVVRAVSPREPSPALIRARTTAATAGIELRLEAGTASATADAFYLVAEAGRHNVGTLAVEANTVSSNGVTIASGGWRQVSFSAGFQAPPVVLAGVQTANDPGPVQGRVAGISAVAAQLKLDHGPGQPAEGANERLGWIAIEQGKPAIIGGRRVEAISRKLTVAGGPVRFAPAIGHRHPTLLSSFDDLPRSTPLRLLQSRPSSSTITLTVDVPPWIGTTAPSSLDTVGIFIGE